MSNRVMWVGIIGFGLVVISFPTVVLIFVGMLPTLVAWVIDRTEEKFATFCVGGVNFCGVFPHLLDLWNGDHTVSAAMGAVTDVFKLATMYGAAAFGWMLFMSVPPVIASFLQVMSQRRLTTLRAEQRALIEEWGTEVGAAYEGGDGESAGVTPPA